MNIKLNPLLANEMRKILNQEPFDKAAALILSDKLHQEEENGVELSSPEDRLWMQLTSKIEATG